MYIEDHKVARSWIAAIYAQKECKAKKADFVENDEHDASRCSFPSPYH